MDENKKKKQKKMMEDLKEKNFFSTYDLAKSIWFPINSPTTIIKLIELGDLKAINVSFENKPRYKIKKEEAINYLVKKDEQKTR